MPIFDTQLGFSGGSVPQYGEGAPYVARINIPLDAALENEEFIIVGNWLYAVDASSKTVTVNIALENESSGLIPFGDGSLIAGIPFAKIYVTSAAVAGGYITLLAIRFAQNPQFVLNPANQFNDISLIKGQTLHGTPADFTTTGAAAAVSMVAANSTRRRLVVQADVANPDTVRIGGYDVLANAGIALSAGQSVEITSTADVYCWDAAAGNTFHFIAEYD